MSDSKWVVFNNKACVVPSVDSCYIFSMKNFLFTLKLKDKR